MSAPQSLQAAIHIRDIRLNNLSMEDVLNAIHAALVRRVPTRIAFVNADCVNIAAGNSIYQQDLLDMDWVFADGIGVRLAGQLLKQPVRDNVNGTDLFPLLCEQLAAEGRSLFLLGGAPGVAQATADWAMLQYPGLRVIGTQHGFWRPDELHLILEWLHWLQPDVLLVGLGAPRQERWIQENMSKIGSTVVMGVGGLFDYYSGRIPRAPMWMRRIGLEWVWRLVQEPRRLFRRYIVGNWVFMARVMAERVRQALKGRKQ